MLNKIKNQKGVSLFLALVIMTIFLAMGLGLSVILVSQKKMIRGIDYSVIAVGAADTGVEEILYLDRKCIDESPSCDLGICKGDCSGVKSGYNLSGNLSNRADYEVTFSRNCGLITIKSTGSYKEVKRAFEINFGYSLAGVYLNQAGDVVPGRNCSDVCGDYDCECYNYGTDADMASNLNVREWDETEGCRDVYLGDLCDDITMDPVPPFPNFQDCEGNRSRWTYCNCTSSAAVAMGP